MRPECWRGGSAYIVRMLILLREIMNVYVKRRAYGVNGESERANECIHISAA